ncbi:unnamed protein product [Aphanomyces euteiches]
MQSPGTLPSVEALMAEDEQHPDETDTWPNTVNELDTAFTTFVLEPTSTAQSPSIGISPMTLNWLQKTLGTGTLSASTEHDVSLLSPHPSITPNDASGIKEEFRGEAIDWKAFNETFEESATSATDDTQWKDIPQFRPVVADNTSTPQPPSLQNLITSTVFSIWPLTNLQSSAAPPAPRLPTHEYASDSNKRKAIISPEFVQYESTPAPVVTRRPSKKAAEVKKPVESTLSSIQLGIDPTKMVTDKCLMQNLSRIKDMQEVLNSSVDVECSCGAPVTSFLVYQTLLHPQIQPDKSFQFPIQCPACPNTFQYSWCTGKLWWNKQPRKHCEICKRCGSHRNQHCYDCGHCYFAGVANSFACPCKNPSNTGESTAAASANANDSGEDAAKSPLFHEPPKEDEKEQCPVQ